MGTIRFEHDFTPNIIDPRPGALRAATTATAASPRRACRPPPRPTRRSTRSRSTATRSPPRAPRRSSRTSSTRPSASRPERVGHTLVSGIEFGRETSDPIRRAWTPACPRRACSIPIRRDPFAGTLNDLLEGRHDRQHVRRVRPRHGRDRQVRQITAGFRWDRFDTDYDADDRHPIQQLSRVDEMPNWRAAIAYKPRPNGTIYFDAGTSSNPSAEALSLSVANVNLDPEKNRTFEVGTKWDLLRRPARGARRALPHGEAQRAGAGSERSVAQRARRQAARPGRRDRGQRPITTAGASTSPTPISTAG